MTGRQLSSEKTGFTSQLPPENGPQALKDMPKHIRDKRERESRKRQKERTPDATCGFSAMVLVCFNFLQVFTAFFF